MQELKDLKEELKEANKQLESHQAHQQRFYNNQWNVTTWYKKVDELREKIEELEYPVRPLKYAKDMQIIWRYIRNKKKLDMFLDLTSVKILEKLLIEVDKAEEHAENEYRKRTTKNGGYGMYSDENGGGPVEFGWANEHIRDAIKRKNQ
jgi:vacuolar-type H+-ATPase subunit I/STV1